MKARLVAVGVLSLVLVGCSPGQGSGQQGYLSQPANAVQFLQVTRDGSNLTGNLQSASIPASDPTKVTSFNEAFTGTVSGNQFTLTFPHGLGAITSVSGSYVGDHIQLIVPQADGTLGMEDFAPSNTNTYNSLVEALNQQAAQALADQRAAAASQQQVDQDARSRAALDRAIAAVNSDLSSLASDIGSFASLTAPMNADVRTTYNDTNVTYADLKKVQNEGGGSPDCAPDASTVAADASTVAADQSTVEADQSSEQADVQSVNGDIGRLNADFQTMLAAQAAIPSYQPGGVPSANQMSQAQAQANSAISQADALIATAVKQVQGWVDQANGYAASARAVCG